MGHLDASLKHAITEFPQQWAEWLGVPPGTPCQAVDTNLSTVAPVADKALLIGAEEQVIERMAERFDREIPRAEAAELWTATFLLIGLKYDRALAKVLLRGVHDIMKESDTYLAILEEGIEKGVEKGRADAKQHALVLLGTKRFGAPAPETLAEINAIADLERLDAMLLRMLDAAGWDDLLAK